MAIYRGGNREAADRIHFDRPGGKDIRIHIRRSVRRVGGNFFPHRIRTERTESNNDNPADLLRVFGIGLHPHDFGVRCL